MGFKIIGTGYHLPGEPVSNAELIDVTRMDSTPEWIRQRTGIEFRHVVTDEIKEPNAHIATLAGQMALQRAGISDPNTSEVDAVLVATCTPDSLFPSVASTVSNNLALGNKTLPLDINVACAGFPSALQVAHGLYESDKFRRILVIGSEVFSRIIDPRGRSTAILFGDGAGAWLTERTNEAYGMIGRASFFHEASSDLQCVNDFCSSKQAEIRMNGRNVFRLVADHVAEVAQEAIANADLTEADINLALFHQANSRLIEVIEKKMSIPSSIIPRMGIERSANTSGATIPILASLTEEQGLRLSGNILLVGYGAGFIVHSCVLRQPKSS